MNKGLQHIPDDAAGVDISTASGAAHYSKAKARPATRTSKAKTLGGRGRPSHRHAAAQRKRERQFVEAANVSAAAGYPVTFKFCLTWGALMQGDRRDGHSLHLHEAERTSRLWRNLKGLCHRHGLPFIAMRAPENDARKGSHLHIAMHLPDALLPDLVNVLTHHTGAPSDIVARFMPSEVKKGYLARSACCGWLLQRNTRIGAGGEVGAAEYLSKATSRDGVNVQYRLSDDLSALVRRHRAQISAQDGHKPALARVAA